MLPWTKPGKVDVLFRPAGAQDDANLIWWTPSIKAGYGQIETGNVTTRYLGGFFRPLRGTAGKADLVIGNQYLWTPSRHQWELQGEFRFPIGIGFGAGTAKSSDSLLDVDFVKATLRRTIGTFSYILETQGQDFRGQKSVGSYGAAYTRNWMLVGGADGEQWRTALGYVANRPNALYDPSFEVLYVDGTIGAFPGPKVIFGNATLKMRGAFLSHGARLGRAMGPQGLEFGNPLGFIAPTWNRKLDSWEMGGLVDLRFDKTVLPSGASTRIIEGFVFPVQFGSPRSVWSRFFAGVTDASDLEARSMILSGGYYGNLRTITLSVRVGWNTTRSDAILGIGLLRFF